MRPPGRRPARRRPRCRAPGPASGGGRRGRSSTSSAAWRGRGRRACRGRRGTRSAGAPGREAAGVEAEEPRGVERQRAPERGQAEVAGMDQLHRGRQQGLEADGAAGAASSKGRRFSSSSCGVWNEPTTSIRPDGERLDQGDAGRPRSGAAGQLEEGAVVADVELVERQVVDRGAGGDGEAVGLGARAAPGARRRWRAGRRGSARRVASTSARSRSSPIRSATGATAGQAELRGELAPVACRRPR